MNVGILTYHWVANYGANLQMYSTYMYLKNRGFTPIVINYIPQNAIDYYMHFAGEKQMKCHIDFLHAHCQITREFQDLNEFEIVLKEYNISYLVVGSDSLFNIIKSKCNILPRKEIAISDDHQFPNPFWCPNINVKHVALSVSSQNAHYSDFKNNKYEIGKALLGFDKITVRDEWTKNMVSYFTNGKITPKVTPDPVFSFNSNVRSNETHESIRQKFGLPEKYILFTFNNGRMKAPVKWIKIIRALFNSKGYACVSLPRSTGSQKLFLDYEIPMPIDPLEWYDLIRFSNGYIGVLMHPIIVCLHNSVPCYSFDHYGDGPIMFANKESSKIYHIMKKADLLSNHFFLKNNLFFPSPYKVFEKIMGFPIEKVKLFAEKQEKDCIMNLNALMMCLNSHE